MKILLIGSGGREHAIAWKLLQSPMVSELTVAPGNAGIARETRCVAIPVDRIDEIVEYSQRSGIDLVVIGPEAPLAMGLADRLTTVGIPVFGPNAKAAQLESSKVFAKEFCSRHGIPTAAFSVCDNADSILEAAAIRNNCCVVKADGLASGKGVFVCRNHADVLVAINALYHSTSFGTATSRIVVEDLLTGEEVSILVVVEAGHYILLDTSQDHKAAFDHDTGPNTGGMGAYSPAPVVSPALMKKIEQTVIRPVVQGMQKDHIRFVGLLYAGLMIEHDEPQVLEFNVRFGDPETQPLLMRLESDLADLLMAAATGHLNRIQSLKWSNEAAVCVIMASGGYPGKYSTGFEINGLDEAVSQRNIKIFHSGTAVNGSGRLVSAGGRVLGVSARGETIRKACDSVYEAVKQITFAGSFYRSDIGYRALARESHNHKE